MKALCVRQPWASLIALGEKTLECRSWTTRYRGPLVICASQRAASDLDARRLLALLEGAPLGVTVCVVELVDVRPWRAGDERAACSFAGEGFVWQLANPRRVAPVPVKGKLGLWNPDFAVRER